MLAKGQDVKAGPVFCDQQGGWLRKSNIQRRSFWPAVARVEGLPRIRFHDPRHTCATLLLADVNVKVVSERLGHASIQLTLDTYSHVLPGMQSIAAERMDGLLSWAAAG